MIGKHFLDALLFLKKKKIKKIIAPPGFEPRSAGFFSIAQKTNGTRASYAEPLHHGAVVIDFDSENIKADFVDSELFSYREPAKNTHINVMIRIYGIILIFLEKET